MVVANNGWVQNASFPTNESDNKLNTTNTNNNNNNSSSNNNNNNINNKGKMSAKGILICRDNSHKFQDRTLNLEQPVKVGRSVARTRAAVDNAIFDCKVLSRNHALLWYSGGKFFLQDTGSSNGTFINNQRLSTTGIESPAKEVSSGDIVQFGVDVVESTKKVTHGCIIATLKLYLPDGKEAKASKSMYMITSPAGDFTLEDLYKLNQYVQEASRREMVLHSKLAYLQKLVDNTRKSANLSWKALIDEDRLLSRIKTVESQLLVYSKNYADDKIKNDMIKLEDDKSQYQLAAKKALEKVHQEKLDLKQKLIQVECRLNETEEECSRLHDISKHSQLELQELATKYNNAQKNLLQLESKLNDKEQNSMELELSKFDCDDKQDLLHKSKQLFKIKNFLQSKLSDHHNDSVNIYKKINLLKNYFQTLLNVNVKLLTDEFNDNNINPMENINSTIDIINRMISSIETMDNDIKNLTSDIIINDDDIDEDDNDVDISKKINKSNINDFDDYNKQFDNYILPPNNSRKTLINGKSINQFIDNDNINDSNLDNSNDDTSSITSDDARTIFGNDDKSDKLLLNQSDEHFDSNIDKSSSEMMYEKESSHFDLDNQSLDTSINDESNVSAIQSSINSKKQINKSDVREDDDDDDDEKELGEEKSEKEEEITRAEIDYEHLDNKIVTEMEEKETEIEKDSKSDSDDEKKEEIENIKTLKPLGKTNDCLSPCSHTRDYVIQIFISSLESLKDDDDEIDGKQLIKKELEDIRDWLVKQSNDIIINKLTEIYYRSKNDKSRMLELNEELAILKEKYHDCYDNNIELTNELRNIKSQCNDVFSCNYNVPIQYFVPVAIALLWMLFEKLF